MDVEPEEPPWRVGLARNDGKLVGGDAIEVEPPGRHRGSRWRRARGERKMGELPLRLWGEASRMSSGSASPPPAMYEKGGALRRRPQPSWLLDPG